MTQRLAVPPGYHSIQPYLIFSNCREAIGFYQRVFAAREKMCVKNSEGRVVHAEVEIGDSVIMMADESSASGAFPAEHYGGSPVSILLYIDLCDAIYRQALRAGAVSLREPTDRPYGDRMAGVIDPFGYTWWIATPREKAAPKQN